MSDRGAVPVIRVAVYGKRDCCLCDDAKAALLDVRREIPFDLEVIDIESIPPLRERYGDSIPVVFVNGRLAFKHRVDEGALRQRLARELA